MHDRTPTNTSTQPPDELLAELLAGAERFASGLAAHPHQDVPRRRELAAGQHPHVVVIACSDSRVAPELLLDQGLGDLFTIRTAGHVIGKQAIASVEFALAQLGAELILVLGHERCGAVNAAVDSALHPTPDAADEDPLALRALGSTVAAVQKHLDPSDPARDAELRHVRACVAELETASPFITAQLASGRVRLAGAVCSLAAGTVELVR